MAVIDDITTVKNNIKRNMPAMQQSRVETTRFVDGGVLWWNGEAAKAFQNKYHTVMTRMQGIEGYIEQLNGYMNSLASSVEAAEQARKNAKMKGNK